MSLLPADVQQRADAELGSAWRRVEAALPEGWTLYDLTSYHYDSDCGTEWPDGEWTATAGLWSGGAYGGHFSPGKRGTGATPTEALEALLTALEERS